MTAQADFATWLILGHSGLWQFAEIAVGVTFLNVCIATPKLPLQ